MRWHYITGVVFGLFTLTFAFSGLLSMEPFAWTNATGLQVPRDVLTGGPAGPSRFPAVTHRAAWDRVLEGRGIKEMEFARIQDDHYYVVRHAADPDGGRQARTAAPAVQRRRHARSDNRLLVAADTLTFAASRSARTRSSRGSRPRRRTRQSSNTQLLTEVRLVLLLARAADAAPVLRVKFADPAETGSTSIRR